MKIEGLITKIDASITRLNAVKNTLKTEKDVLENNELLFIAIRHFINKMESSIAFYSMQFIKNENT